MVRKGKGYLVQTVKSGRYTTGIYVKPNKKFAKRKFYSNPSGLTAKGKRMMKSTFKFRGTRYRR